MSIYSDIREQMNWEELVVETREVMQDLTEQMERVLAEHELGEECENNSQ